MPIKTYRYHNELVSISFSEYQNGGTAIRLWCEDGPFATATVWTDGLLPNEVAIKDYAENIGMYRFLVVNKIIKQTHREIKTGWVSLPVCYLNDQEENNVVQPK